MDEGYSLLAPGSEARQRVAKAPQFIAGITACLAPLIFGYTLGYSSPTLKEFEDEGILDTESKRSWFGSIVTIGAIVGGPIAGFLVEKIGRKSTIIFCCFPYSIGWLLLVIGGHFTKAYQVLYLARFICGIGTGMTSLCVPLYIGEIATKEVRGALGAGFQLSVTVGVLCAYTFGLALSWRWMAIVGSCFSVTLVIVMLFMPETPHFLIRQGNKEAAVLSLRWLRGPNIDVEIECEEITRTQEAQQGTFHLRELGTRGIFLPLAISLALMFFQQMSGINAVIFYAGSIFTEAGFNGDPNVAAVIVGAVQVVATFVSCLLMDRLGRRVLLLLAGVFMCLSTVAFGVYYYIHNPSLNWLPLVSLNVFVIAFSLGWGPIPWLILGEIFPDRVKGFASGAAAVTNWTLAFLVTKEFSQVEAAITNYGTFWLFAGVCLCGVVFVAVFMPETKGKSLEEIQQSFEPRSPDENLNSEYEGIGQPESVSA